MRRKKLSRDPSPLLLGRRFVWRALSEVTLKYFRQYLRSQRDCVLGQDHGTVSGEMARNDIDELVEEHRQKLTTEELIELHCVSQKTVVEENLSEEEQVTANQQSSGAIREMLEA
ncbi:hypothetical protein AVEN_50003-1 [Araneus ventricosus]|uniref:Uncharacterized protein n=1 Tax=Araneus ventricosus TaxID=182803 RepID=A0A4Y2D3Z8_ARAVE|nr:hypothetical protein AVEN_50003-1 [Araneus ventricosus]